MARLSRRTEVARSFIDENVLQKRRNPDNNAAQQAATSKVFGERLCNAGAQWLEGWPVGLELSQVELTIRTNRVLPHRPQTGVLWIFGFLTRIWTSRGSAPRGEFSSGTPLPHVVDVDRDCALHLPAASTCPI